MTSPEQLIKLTAADAAAGDRFGVSVSTDGLTTLIGSYWDDDQGSETGAAYLSARQADGSWSSPIKLVASDAEAGDRFGREIDVFGDIAVVGAYLDDHESGSDSGSAYIFQRQADGSWLEIQKLTASDATGNDYYGRSVAVYGDTMVVGSYQDDDNGRNSGSAYIYKQQADGSWIEVAKLTATDGGKNDEFGYDVSIYGDTIAIGSQNDDDNGSNSGAAYIFKAQTDGSWSQVAKLGATDGAAGDLFGYSVSVGDGRVAVGAFLADDGGTTDAGAAYVFEEQADGSWVQTSKLTGSTVASGDRFGRDVSLDGDKILVGAYLVGVNAGSAYLYEYQPNGSWQETSIIEAEDTAANDRFGRSVSLAGDTIAVGAYRDTDAGDESGSAYVFTTNPDSGPGAIAFDTASYIVAEDGGSVTVTVVRAGGSEGIVTVNVVSADGTATGNDYTDISQTLTFEEGETTKTITLDITDDAIPEGDETILLSLNGATGGASLGTTSSATVTIEASDNPGAIAFATASYTVAEDGTNATITLVRTGGDDGAVTVDVSFTDNTATAGLDYTIPANTTVSFADGETSKTITVPLLDDVVTEGDETLDLSLSNFTGGAIPGSQTTAILTITDNDVPGTIAFDTSSYSVNEEDGTATITIVRSGGNAGTVSVDLTTADGTAIAPDDYGNGAQTVTFGNGETSKTVTVSIVDDTTEESDETVNLSLANATGGASIGSQNTATLTIVDNDGIAAPVRIEAEDYIAYSDTTTGNSGDSTYRLDDVDLYATTDASGHVVGGVKNGEWLEYDLTLPQNGDYDIVVRASSPRSVGQSLDITLGGQTYNLPIAKTGGWQVWQDFTLSGVSLSGGNQTLRLTINQDRFQINYIEFIPIGAPIPVSGEISFEEGAYTVAEDGSSASVTIVRANGSDGEVSATVNFADGTATAGSDYDGTSQVVTFADGETTKVITVPIVNDTETEGDETLNLALTNPTGGASLGTTSSATVTIEANDNPGAIAFATASYTVAEDGTNATITLVRTGGDDGAVTVDVSFTDNTATAGLDYTIPANTTVSFADGETSKTITVPLLDDVVTEGDETLDLSLSNFTGGAIPGSQTTAILTITDNDVPGTIAFDTSSYSVNEEDGTATITIVRSGGNAGTVSVDLTTADGTAIAPDDYGNGAQTVTFGNGETSKTVTVSIVDDTTEESDETVNLSLANATGGASIGSQNTATLTIVDNDGIAAPVRIEAEDYIAYSDTTTGNSGDSTYRLDDVDLYATTDASGHVVGGVKNGEWLEYDLTLPQNGDYDIVVRASSPRSVGQSLDITLGGQTYNLPIAKTGGWQVWQDFTLSGVSLSGGNQTLRLTINQDRFQINYIEFIPIGAPIPVSGEISFEEGAYTVAEDGSSASVTIVRANGSDGEVSATVNFADGTATAGSDYDGTSQVVTFADGETTKVITVPIVNDTETEGDETLNLALTNPTGGAALGSTSSATLTIQTNDQYGAIAFDAATYSVIENETTATVTLNRSGGSDGAVSVDVATTDGTATAGADYTDASQTVTFADGETTKTITITISDDSLEEGNETINLALSNVTGGATIDTQSTAVLTIVDDDIPIPGEIAFDSGSYTVAEDGGSATITLVRTVGSDGEVQVDVTLVDGTAIAGSDYDGTAQTVAFADGETSKVVTVPIINDTVTEEAETVNLAIANPTNGASVGSQSTAVLTIETNDQYGAVAFDSDSYTVAEDGATATINVVRTGGTDGIVTVDVTLADGSAIAPDDYTNGGTQTITFLTGEDSQPLEIPIIDDTDEEGDETVGLSLSNTTGGAILGNQDTATLTISDDDTPAGPVRVEGEDYTTYFDTSSGNSGGAYRSDDVDLYTTTDASGIYVGDIKAGEYLEYDVTLPGSPGGFDTFDAVVRVVSTKNLAHSIDLEIGGDTHTFNFGKTSSSWNTWTDILLEDLTLPTGEQSFRLTMNSKQFHFNYIEFIPTEPAGPSPGEIALDSSLFTVDEDAGTATITLVRTSGDDGEVTVDLSLSDGSAVSPTDYTNIPLTTVTFADGVTTQTITVPIVDDTEDEGTETVNIALSNVTGGALLGSQDTGILAIQDNDATPGSGPIRVMPLGDSITFGYGTDWDDDGIIENTGGYRIRLEDLFANNNIGIDFVGGETGGPPSLTDQDNEGHPGYRIDEIASEAATDDWFTAAAPDVVLLMLGTNDMNQDYQVTTAPDRLSALIDQVLMDVPDTHVIVSTIPTTTKSFINPDVEVYNAAIPGVVNTKISEGKSVSLVDINSVISTDELADSLHPTLEGYNDAAGVWFDGVLDILDNYGDYTANNDDLYANVAILNADDYSTTVQADIFNNSGVVQNDLSLRYFVDLTELMDAGYSSSDVIIGNISGPTVGNLSLWDATNDVYYVDVDFSGTAIAPSTSVTVEFSLGIDTLLPSSAWDQSNDWSAQTLTTSLEQSRYVPIYDSGSLISGAVPA